jgi:glycosyltransferase involved in cell wall biosynthesis
MMAISSDNKKNIVVFITTLPLSKTYLAGYSRIMNYSKALVIAKTDVYLFSLENKFESTSNANQIDNGIYIFNSKRSDFSYYLESIMSLYKLKRSFQGRDVVYIYYPTSKFFADFVVLFLFKVISKSKLFCEINELRRSYIRNRHNPDDIKLRFIQKAKNAIDFMFFYLLEFLSFSYNGLIIISNNLNNYYSKLNSNTLIIPVLVEVPTHVNKEINVNDFFDIGFFGSVSLKKEGLNNVFQAIIKLKANSYNIRLNLFGHSNFEEYRIIKEFIISKNLSDSILLKGVVNHDQVLMNMGKMNLLVLPRPRNDQTHFGFSTKLGEYLVSGVPSLVTDVSDNGLYMRDGHNGYLLTEITPQGFYDKIEYIIRNYEKEKDRIVVEAFKTAQKFFNYKNYATNLHNFLFFNKE